MQQQRPLTFPLLLVAIWLLAGTTSIALWTQKLAVAQPPNGGGETTIVLPHNEDRKAFSYPAKNLSGVRKQSFFVGNSFFRNSWVTAPASTKARDGLGPLFNTHSCQSCHIRDGRGSPPKVGDNMESMLVRVSRPQTGAEGEAEILKTKGAIPDPMYGLQIQNHAVLGVKAEARVEVEWEEIKGAFKDGTPYSLRKPKIVMKNLGYGPLAKDLQISPRVAPIMIGLGLLDTVPEETLIALEDPNDENRDGISGRRNLVWDIQKKETVTGRFGWKAEQPSVRQQVAAAFVGDIGITSELFPEDGLTAAQRKLIKVPHGGTPEVKAEIFDAVVFYSKTLAVPAQRSHDAGNVLRGQKLFQRASCNACHVETMRTGNDPDFPELSNQEIHAYTDLLLHDMGEGLADNRPSFRASGREWRTAPLWGLRLVKLVNQHTTYLHDGRARNIEEAILWHGGEAEASRDMYLGFNKEERQLLLAFLSSL